MRNHGRIFAAFLLIMVNCGCIGTALSQEADAPAAGEAVVLFGAASHGLDDVRSMLSRPDDRIDVGMGNLLIAKNYYGRLDVQQYLGKLDAMAAELRSRIGKKRDPENLISVINHYVFEEGGLTAIDDPYPTDFLLNDLLDTKRGRCMSLTALYTTLCHRLQFPVAAVCIPEHIFVRWTSAKKWSIFKKSHHINIETTRQGIEIADSDYQTRHPELLGDPAMDSFYLRPLTRREMLAAYLSPLGSGLLQQGRVTEAIDACRLSLEVNPGDAEAWNNLGMAYRKNNQGALAKEAYQKAVAINPRFAEAWQNLGSLEEDNDRRIEYYRQAITIKPSLSDAWRNLVLAYSEAKKYQLAWTCVMQCRALGHNLPPDLVRSLEIRLQRGP